MNVDEQHKKKIAQWIAEGLKLSEIQNRIAGELGLRLTYMDVRLLVDDLKLTPKDPEPPKAPAPPAQPPRTPDNAPPDDAMLKEEPGPAPAAGGNVSLTVDQLTRPGAIVSGKVTFSDGTPAEWYLDQSGRLGLVPSKAGYRPPPADIPKFQAALESELSKLGF